MSDTLTLSALVLASASSALLAGVFLTFSDFVMRSLGAASPRSGVDAMQQINVKVFRSVFMVLFLGLVPGSLALLVLGTTMTGGAASWTVAGAVLYLVGVFGVTAARNVPLNDRLAHHEPGTGEADRFWQGYLVRWTRWNHVRAAASLAAAAAYLTAAFHTVLT